MVDLRRLIVGRGETGADSPDGLVGDDDVLKLFRGNAAESHLDLFADDLHRHAFLALLEILADAEDDLETGVYGGADALRDGLVGLAEVGPSLAVADDDVGNAHRDEHRGGYLARESALVRPVDVLGAYLDVGAGGGLKRDLKIDVGDAGDDLALRVGYEGYDLLEKGLRLGGGLVHFPVAGDYGGAFCFIHYIYLRSVSLFVEAGDAGKHFALKELERGAAAGGDVCHPVGVAELFDRRGGVAAADDGDGAGLGYRVSDGNGAAREMLPLGNAHRAVPDDRAGVLDRLGVKRLGRRADVKTHPAVGDGVGVDGLVLRVLVVLFADDIVDGQKEGDALFGGLRHKLLREVDLVLLADGGAGREALGAEEGVSHAAADEEPVDLFEKVVDDADLVGDLRAAEDGDERALRILESAAHDADLFADKVAADAGPAVGVKNVGYAGGGGMSSVGAAESVVYVNVAQRRELLGKLRIVLGLARLETDVLEKDGAAVLKTGDESLSGLADDVGSHLDVDAQKLGEPLRYGSEGVLGIGAALRPAEMGAKHDSRAVGKKIFDRGERGDDALIAGDDAVRERDVEIAADKHALAGYVDVFDCLFVERTHIYAPFP